MHPFAKYIQILGKGRNGARSLTRDEAYEAMKLITTYDIEPEQIGAFMMLMRVKEETADEVAGFTQALKESIPAIKTPRPVAIDWAAYAGKRRQLPWFVLAALIMGQRGYPVFMHGLYRKDERVYVPDALDALGIETATSLEDAAQKIRTRGFAYLSIAKISRLAAGLIADRELYGLRPPVHTVARMLNPMNAELSVMGVFHPNYAQIHLDAAQALGQQQALIAKGEGGELERVPDREVTLFGLSDADIRIEKWERMEDPGKQVKPASLNLNHFCKVWEGEAQDHYGEVAVIGTLAMLIRALDLASDPAGAHELAAGWWRERHALEPVQEAV